MSENMDHITTGFYSSCLLLCLVMGNGGGGGGGQGTNFFISQSTAFV